MKNGLFANHSYYLNSSSTSNSVLDAIGKSGGISAILGGSYAVVESASSGPSDSGSSDAGTDSESESSEESSESAEDGSGVQADGQSSSLVTLREVLGAAPFAPISSPVLSPQASLILEEALSSEVEFKLSNYIDR